MEFVLYIRLARDCGYCRAYKNSGLIDHLEASIPKQYPNFTVIVDEVDVRVIGNPAAPDVFNYLKITPYFMCMARHTYDSIIRDNPPLEKVANGIAAYNVRFVCITKPCTVERTTNYNTTPTDESVTKFCVESYAALTGDTTLAAPRSNSSSTRRVAANSVGYRR